MLKKDNKNVDEGDDCLIGNRSFNVFDSWLHVINGAL